MVVAVPVEAFDGIRRVLLELKVDVGEPFAVPRHLVLRHENLLNWPEELHQFLQVRFLWDEINLG